MKNSVGSNFLVKQVLSTCMFLVTERGVLENFVTDCCKDQQKKIDFIFVVIFSTLSITA